MPYASRRMIVYSYVRMSSVAQTKGDSARRQIDQAREYAERHGYTLAPPLKDLGVSAFRGTHRKKGALGIFLNALEEGTIAPGILVIEALDRLSREPPLEIIDLIRRILDTGTEIHLLRFGRTLTKQNINRDAGLLSLISASASMAHEESAQKSERIEAAYRTRQKQARQGVKLRGNYHPAWLRRVYHPDGKVEHFIIEEVAAAVRKVFELAACGMGSHSIARVLNETGVPVVPAHLGGKDVEERQARRRWYQSYVGRLTLDRRVLGEYQPKKMVDGKSVPDGEPIIGHFDPIITRELWDQVQAAKHPKHGTKTGGRKLQFSNLFTGGVARCGHCGSYMLMLGDYRKGVKTPRHYLRCSVHQHGSTCDNRKTPRYNWFERKFLEALPGIPWRQLIASKTQDDGTEKVTREIDDLSRQIDERKTVSSRLLRVIESEDEPDPEILARRREVQADISSLSRRVEVLKADREELRRASRTDDGVVDEATALIAEMEAADEAARFEIRQRLHALIRRIVEKAEFFSLGYAIVHVRGGFTLEIPLDEHSPVTANLSMERYDDFLSGDGVDGVPFLNVSQDGTKLVRDSQPEARRTLKAISEGSFPPLFPRP